MQSVPACSGVKGVPCSHGTPKNAKLQPVSHTGGVSLSNHLWCLWFIGRQRVCSP